MQLKKEKTTNRRITKFSFILMFFILLAPVFSVPQLHAAIGNPFKKISTGVNEIKDSISETKEFFEALGRFAKTVAFPIKKISSLVGGTTLILLFFILIISSGLGALGIPKGKFTFFAALLIADSLWLAWGNSTNSNMVIYFFNVAKTNIILLSPFFVYIITKKYFPSTISKLIGKIPFKFKKGISPKEAEFLSKRFSDESLLLLRKLSKDLEKGKTDDKVILSDDSLKSIRNVKKLLEKFPE